MRETQDDLVNLRQLRAQYGDAIVDTMLALEPDLTRLANGLGGLRWR